MVTDAGVNHIAARCALLSSIDLTGLGNITDAAMRCLAECGRLADVNLMYCRGVSDQGLVYLARGAAGRSIRAITFGGYAVASKCGLCAGAWVEAWVSCLSNALLPHRTGHSSQFAFLFARNPAPSPARRMVGVGLTILATECPSIRTITATRCPDLDAINLTAVSPLTSLELSHCWAIDDATLGNIAVHCPHLTSLSVRNCQGLTDAGLGRVVETCLALAKLDVSFCTALSDRILEHMVQRPATLEELDLTFCFAFSDAALANLITNCTGLKAVNLYFAGPTSDGSSGWRRQRFLEEHVPAARLKTVAIIDPWR